MHKTLIQVRSNNGLVTVDLRGALDRTNGDRVRAALAMAGRLASHTVVIDTSQLDFVDLTTYRILTAGNAAGRVPTVLVKGRAVTRLEALMSDHPAIRDHAA
jgi:anti-anti-sigma regulatory factor